MRMILMHLNDPVINLNLDYNGNVIEVGNDLREFSRKSSGVSLLLNDITISGNID